MDENRLHDHVTQAVDHHCAHLQTDPFLAQRVIRRAERKEPFIVRGKMRLGLILVLMIMMLTATALAAVILSGMEIVQETAVPMAIDNDGGQLRPNENYSSEELQKLILLSAENGLILDDDTAVMKAFRRGEGYNEEEAIMAICREAFGGLYYQWTLEQRHWFNEMLIAIGYRSENPVKLPGPDEMTSEDARQLARETVWKHYGAAVPLTDPEKYRMEEEFHAGTMNEGLSGEWIFRFVAQDIRDAGYWVSLDSQGNWAEHSTHVPDWTNYNVNDLVRALRDRYSTSGSWYGMEQEGWVLLGEMLPGAARTDAWSIEYDAFLRTNYVRQEAGDMDRKALRELLSHRLVDSEGDDRFSAVLIELDGRHVWHAVSTSVDETGHSGPYRVFEVDARTGEILIETTEDFQRPSWADYVPERVYREMTGDSMTADEAIDLAIQALQREYGDDAIPFRDENIYRISCTANASHFSLRFSPLVLGYGRSSLDVNCETGEVSLYFANPMGLTSDTLYRSYTDIYGSCGKWDQAMWVKFGQHMASLTDEAATFDGRLFRQTVYADDSQVAISRSRACDIAVLACGDRTTDVVRCMLINAEPNPVWKIRLGTWPVNCLYEVDAMTGEILDREWYFIQDPTIDHDMKMFTLRSVFMSAYLAEYGAERVAMEYAVKSDVGRYAYEGHDQFLDGEQYYVQTEGLTVTFAALTEKGVSYRVTVAEDGMSADVQVLSDVSELLKAAPEGSTAWSVGHYGLDRQLWPEGQQGGDEPLPGEMTEEEAIAHARKALIDEVGQEAFDALGELYIAASMSRVTNVYEWINWNVRFISKASMEDNDPLLEGWRVHFSFRDGVLTDDLQIQDANDKSNG